LKKVVVLLVRALAVKKQRGRGKKQRENTDIPAGRRNSLQCKN